MTYTNMTITLKKNMLAVTSLCSQRCETLKELINGYTFLQSHTHTHTHHLFSKQINKYVLGIYYLAISDTEVKI